MNIGYARVSTLDQTLDVQMQALRKSGCKTIFRERVSGDSRKRPEFQRMLDQLRQGDTVIMWRLDRLARSTRDLLQRMETIGDPRVPAFSQYLNRGRTPQVMLAS